MRTELDPLPKKYQRELRRAIEILHEEFERAVANKSFGEKYPGRILKVILFGSFATQSWVDDRLSGYKSDFDILIVVNAEKYTDIAEFWSFAEDRLLNDSRIKREVNFIVHSIEFVNQALSRSRYFFVDIYHQGVMLFEHKPAKRLKKPQPLNVQMALEEAEEHFEYWMSFAESFSKVSANLISENQLRHAAFELHQAVESLYNGFLLVRTNYSPNSHNINHLRSLVNGFEPNLTEIFPDADKSQRRAFNRLKEAYVKARYSKHYVITEEELIWLAGRVELLTAQVKAACEAHIAGLRSEVR